MSFKFNQKKGPIADINVTPLVDVMLVLLVIFMISAPLMYSGIKLNLPKTKKVNTVKLDNKNLILSINKKKEIFIDKTYIPENRVVETVLEKMKTLSSSVLFIRADYGLDYGTVAKLMANLKKAGVSEISLVTEIEN